jgi:Ca2+-binding EF-hand superfamily protein
VNLGYSEKELKAMLEAADKDKDGSISKEEFLAFLYKKRKLN